jgi:hypothetical protein
MTSTEEGGNSTPPFLDEESTIDRRAATRAAQLLRWYPKDWRERYGDEFEALLCSSLTDGKGGIRFSIDVAREGLVTRLESAGFVGQSAPPLERARASVATIFVAILGFLTTTAVLAYYEKGWQRAPAFEFLQKAIAQRQATNALNTEAGRAFQRAVRSHFASGAPVIFNDIVHVATDATIACLGTALFIATLAAFRLVRQGNRKRLLVSVSFLITSTVLFVLGEMAYQAFQKIPPGQPGSELTALKWVVLDGYFRFWPVVIFPVCTAVSILFAIVGGVKLVRRVDFGSRIYRLLGFLAVLAAGCLAVVLASTLAWAVTLYVQAPGVLTSSDQGILGTSLLPWFLVAVVVMVGTGWLVAANTTRCLHSVRNV